MKNDPAPPNILFLMDDQHRYDVAGFMGNDVVRTPRLDRLAEDSVIFDNAYTPSPVCVPGRQCIMSGQLPTTNGCQNYGDDLPPFSRTFARQLSERGYSTVCAGKLHHQGMDQMQGWSKRIGNDTHVEPPAYGDQAVKNHRAFEEGKLPMWSLEKELRMAGHGKNYFGQNDKYSLEGALTFLQEYFCGTLYDRSDTRPLMLKVSFQQPHYPFICTEEKFDYYINRVSPYPDRKGIIDHYFAKDWTHDPNVTDREKLRAIAAYYGMIEEVDTQFGTVLDQLEKVGQDLDDWVIIYTTDHGEMLGEFNTWWKLKFYEGSVHVPLFIRAPKFTSANKRVSQNVSLCDLYATICDMAGAQTPDDRDSRSLLPLMSGNEETWPDTAISGYADHLMIKQGPWKYWNLHPDREVLFNLDSDPHEEKDLASLSENRERLTEFRSMVKKLRKDSE